MMSIISLSFILLIEKFGIILFKFEVKWWLKTVTIMLESCDILVVPL